MQLKIWESIYKEGIYVDNDNLVFDYSNNLGIDVSLNKKKYFIAHGTSSQGKILSLYFVKPEDKQILRILKNESNIVINKKDIEHFVKRSAIYAYHNLKVKDIDYILYNQNSYPMFDLFIKELSSKFSSKVIKLNNSIYKTKTSEIKLVDNIPENLRPELEKLLLKIKGKDIFKLRNDVIPRYRKFFTNFLSIPGELKLKLRDKNVLYVDDIFTTGSTFKEIFTILELCEVNYIQGLSIFKFQ